MENKNSSIIITLLVLIIGLLVGYAFGTNNSPSISWMNDMHREAGEHMNDYNDNLIREDGAMQHSMDEMMLGFRGKSGEAYEEAFLRGMIVHHLGAIRMAENLLEETERPELEELAQNIIESQSQEVETMKGWLEEWFNN
jgi:uncharacterized protein (DUF305 family)